MKRLLLIVCLLLLLAAGSASAGPNRVVSLVPSVTESIYALGAEDLLVGVTAWCDYPPQAQEKTVVGDAFNLNLEVLVNLEPDLVIGDAGLVSRYLDSLQELEIPVFSINPLTYADTAAALVALGDVLGRPEAGRRQRDVMLTVWDQVIADVSTADGPRVFIETWNEPLSTAGPGSFLHEMLIAVGGQNIASDLNEAWGQISPELVIVRDPEIILITSTDRQSVLNRPGWGDVQAVRDGRVYEVDPDIFFRAGPRLAEALTALAALIAAR